MKKLLVMAAALFAATMLFAEEYEVKAVTGKVTCAESVKGKQQNVVPGMKVTDDTLITLSPNSKLVIEIDGKEVSLRTPQKGTIAEYIAAKNEIAGTSAKKGKGTATAASRASDVMAEGELDD